MVAGSVVVVVAALTRLPATVSTSCSSFASTTTTMPGSWKHSADGPVPLPREARVAQSARVPAVLGRLSQIPSPYSGRLLEVGHLVERRR